MCDAEALGTQASTEESSRGGKGLQPSGTSQGMQKEDFLPRMPVRRWGRIVPDVPEKLGDETQGCWLQMATGQTRKEHFRLQITQMATKDFLVINGDPGGRERTAPVARGESVDTERPLVINDSLG